MTIAFPCESCGHRFEVDASLAGKKCKCKKCGHIFLIPKPQASQTTPRPRPAATRPSPKPSPAFNPYLDEDEPADPYGLQDLPSPPPRSAPAVAVERDEEFYPSRAPKAASASKSKARNGSGEE